VDFVKLSLNVLIAIAALSLVGSPSFAAKKFKRALIIAGGSITPGVGIGMMQALREKGQEPDVIITTCGSSLATTILNSYPNPKDALEFAKSDIFYATLLDVHLAVPNAIPMAKTFTWLRKNPTLYPPLFDRPLLKFKNDLEGILPHDHFPVAGSTGPKFIIQSSKVLFKPSDVGHKRSGAPLFQQVYFTDTDTAEALRGFKSPVKKIFPKSSVAENVEIRSDVTMAQATRGGISDPFLINPGEINGQYYFTGAIDLLPMELAHEIADEVISTYPATLFTGFQDLAIQSAFGFNQTDRALKAIQDTDVKWIDVSGIAEVNFEPTSFLIFLKNQIPKTKEAFDAGVQGQYDFGYTRTQEALKVQSDRKNVRTHLREPINPKLYDSFTCKNANVWKTSANSRCEDDRWPGCNRATETACTPIR
jgi:hypothetical protein